MGLITTSLVAKNLRASELDAIVTAGLQLDLTLLLVILLDQQHGTYK